MRVVISGYYGFGNAGDEAALQGVLAGLRRAANKGCEKGRQKSRDNSCEESCERGGIDALVLSGEPEATRAEHGVAAVSRWSLGAAWRAVRGADLLVFGGGGLIQDRTSARSALYYLAILAMARAARVPVYLYGQGAGPLRRRWLRRAAGVCLRGVTGAGVRDEASLRLLEELGVPPERIQVTADAAFALEPPSERERAEALERLGFGGGRGASAHPLVGVVWRSPAVESARRLGSGLRALGGRARGCEGAGPREAIAGAVASFARANEAAVVVVPLHPQMDLEEAQEFAKAAGAGGDVVIFSDPAGVHAAAPQAGGSGLSPRTQDPAHRRLMAAVAAMDIVVSVRFHGLVFAALAGVPAVAIAYDPKVQHLAEALGVPWFEPGADPDQVRAALEAVWSDREAVSRRLAERAAEFRRRSLAEGERALVFAKRGGKGRDA